MSRRVAIWTLALALAAAALSLVAQAPPAPSTPPAAATEASVPPAGTEGPVPGDDNMLVEGDVLYRHQGDRDPFTPLVRGTQGTSDVVSKPGDKGLARFTVESCALEAIVRSGGGTAAWFQGPDSKPYKAVVGEHFADGVVIDISFENGEVVVQQELNDPTAIKPYRNLPLKIRNVEGEGQ